MSADQQYFQALQCPICPNIFVESLWSLISHLQTSHAEQNSFKLLIENLEKVKKYVPRKCVSIIRPAFTEEGKPTDFLNMLISHSSSTPLWNASSTSQFNCSFSAELNELSSPSTKTCKQCGEMVPQLNYSNHVCLNLKKNPFCSLGLSETPSTSSITTTNMDEHQKLGLSTTFNSSKESNNLLQSVVQPAKPFHNTMSSILSEMSAPVPSSISIIDRRRKRLQLGSTATIKQPARADQQMISSKKASSSKSSALMCSQCGRSFENRCKLTRHLIDHKMEQSPYRCPFPVCLQSYDSRLKFRNHLLRVHKQISEEEITLLLEEGDKELIRLAKNNGRQTQAPEAELNLQLAGSSASNLPANTGSSDVEFAAAEGHVDFTELLTPKQEMEL